MSDSPNIVRKKIKWPTGRRKGGSRVWKTRWVTVHVPPKGKEKAAKA